MPLGRPVSVGSRLRLPDRQIKDVRIAVVLNVFEGRVADRDCVVAHDSDGSLLCANAVMTFSVSMTTHPTLRAAAPKHPFTSGDEVWLSVVRLRHSLKDRI